MIESFIINTLDELDTIAATVLSKAKPHTFFSLYGEMGVGKTTLIKSFCKYLGVKENVSSPTFSILNEYTGGNNEPVYHFDFYRLKTEAEAFDLGYENFFYSNHYCFVEWSEKIPNLLSFPKASIFIESNNGVRYVRLQTDSL